MRVPQIAAGFLFGATALKANECGYDLLNSQTVLDAKSVSIVRIDALDNDQDANSQSLRILKGRFTVAESLRGDFQGTEFRYEATSCCGIRLDEGHYYAVFLREVAPYVLLTQENTLHVGTPNQIDRRKASQLRRVVKGEFKLEGAFGENSSKALMPLGCASN